MVMVMVRSIVVDSVKEMTLIDELNGVESHNLHDCSTLLKGSLCR